MGRLPRGGRRPGRQGRAVHPQRPRRARPTSRACSTPPTWIEAREAIVDGEVVALDEAGRPDFGLLQERISAGPHRPAPVPLVYQAFDLLYLDGRSLLDVPLEQRKRLLGAGAPPDGARPVRRRTSRPRASRSSRRPGRRPRGDRGQAPPLALRAGPAGAGLAEDQGPARAGAGRRRLDARGGERQGARGAGRWGSTRASGCGSPARWARGSRADADGAARAARAARDRRPAVRPRAAAATKGTLGRRPRRRALGPAGARDPGRDRRLDAGRARPPDRVQGHRAGPRPAGGRPRAGGRPGEASSAMPAASRAGAADRRQPRP